MMIPTGPSPCTNGIRFSSSSANMSNGSEKASVLPEPVKAMPIMSRPEKLFEAVLTCQWAGEMWMGQGGLTLPGCPVVGWASALRFSSS